MKNAIINKIIKCLNFEKKLLKKQNIIIQENNDIAYNSTTSIG